MKIFYLMNLIITPILVFGYIFLEWRPNTFLVVIWGFVFWVTALKNIIE